MTRMNLGVVVLASAALLVAGCGGSSSSPSVAHLSSSTSSGSPASGGSSSPESSAANQQKMVKFSQCMRTHGEPEFPEPTEGRIQLLAHGHNRSSPNPESPRFQAAEKACSKYAPSKVAPSAAEQVKMQEGALNFSKCMRSHGVPNFPDPEFSHSGGGVGIRIGTRKGGPSGIDPNSPQFRAAQKACQSDLPLPPGAKGGPGGGEAGGNVVAAP